jgi:hypothetical protein
MKKNKNEPQKKTCDWGIAPKTKNVKVGKARSLHTHERERELG